MIKTIEGQVDLFSIFEIQNEKNEDSIVRIPCKTKVEPKVIENNKIKDFIYKGINNNSSNSNNANSSLINNFDNHDIRKNISKSCVKDLDDSFFKSNVDLPFVNYGLISELSENIQEIILINKDSANRIVYKMSGYLIIDTGDKSIYYNSEGKKEMELSPNLSLLPGDKILVVNKDLPISDIQLKVLKEFKVETCIKRIGDCNLILITDHTIVINKNGWVLDYEQSPVYNANLEVFSLTEESFQNDILSIKSKDVKEFSNNETVVVANKNYYDSIDSNTNNPVIESDAIVGFEIGEKVSGEYGGKPFIGTVYSIYNNGFTINVLWDNNITAFYYKSLTKVR